ncbi:Uncharacterised protein [Mycobacterium tuberculosis]|uniref:Uncharacterized protein n=1 Tax=Mycobacterium tuberculosis TaxID=1773 RepID=A0A655FAA4_MYCTX|nr:Uncharacterised protein [Mycobacterium tuberculosis]CNV57813.1 Uncharacterised protein [Mycobacterium tuberculosis]COV76002.1 Uncharacterised protein [Mycobacterium tuberculosis]COW12802.1 Uncharacterised protein [Mycobacterium tuberculosis]COW13982.1 Uncharacterised protein [Mycobacterium tuberculosis]
MRGSDKPGKPIAIWRRLRSSTPLIESNPKSWKAHSGSMSWLLLRPKTIAAWKHTNSTSWRCSSGGARLCNRAIAPASLPVWSTDNSPLSPNQNRCRANPYVGNSTRRPPKPAKTEDQSTATPSANSRPTPASTDSTSGRSLASSATDASNPAPGPTSTNTLAPRDSANPTPSKNRTGLRTCSTQYAGDPYPAPAS